MSMWHRTSEDKPKPNTLVIGVWEDDAMKCYLKPNNMWIDYLCGSFCYTAPDFWADDPTKEEL